MPSLTVRSKLLLTPFQLVLSAVSLFLLSGFSLATAAATEAELANAQQQLSENLQKWQQTGIRDYELTISKSCYCPLEDVLPIRFKIASNIVTDSHYDCSNRHFIQPEPTCNQPPEARLNQTIEGLFELIRAAIQRKADSIDIEYDPVYGYPVSIGIDYVQRISDEEIGYQMSGFKPVVTPLSAMTAQMTIDHQWQGSPMSVDNAHSVLFYSAPSSVGKQPGVVRMRTSAEGSEFRFQEWSNLDGQHRKERIYLLKLNKGRWQYGEHELEVGSVSISGSEVWKTIHFSASFTTAPRVILALQTAHGGDAVSARVKNITETSMEIRLVEEDLKTSAEHKEETIAFLLVSSPDAGFTAEDNIQFELLAGQPPIELNHVWQTVAKNYQLRLEEDQTVDDEVEHPNELIDLIRVKGVYLSQIVSHRDNDNIVLRSSTDYFEPSIRAQTRIDRLVADKSCDIDEQCKAIAFGAKPCGGARSYLIYSSRQTNEVLLSSEVTRYNELNRLQNEQEGLLSDCVVTQSSFPVCLNNECLPKNESSPLSTASQLTRFTSSNTLEKFIKAGLLEVEKSSLNPYRGELLRHPVLNVSLAAEAGSTALLSSTNIQESGVDEADFVKTDGRSLYVSGPNENQIRILAMHSQPYRVTQQSIIKMDAEDPINLRGLYLLTQRDNQQPDLLTTVHTGSQTIAVPLRRGFSPAGIAYYPWGWMDQKTEINVYNVSNPAQPQKLTRIHIDGGLLSSRQIGDTLVVVTRYVPNIHPLPYNSEQSAEQQVNDRINRIKQAGLAQLLPTMSIHNGTAFVNQSLLVSAQHTFLPPTPEEYRSSDFMTVSRFDLGNLSAPPKTTTIIGNSDTLYVSSNALYLATSRYGYQQFTEVLDESPDFIAPPVDDVLIPKHTTQIHKISLMGDQPDYQGSGSIEGLITGNEDQRRFRFSEYDQILRVVTTGQWGDLGENRVTLLRENEAGHLDEIAHLPNTLRPQPLGKPGERLFATRFVKNRLFLVTFQRIDPLIALDLSDPSDPKLQGELEIPGFSDYLHPLNENLLLGIGKHAVPAVGQGDGGFAWFQGIRLGLFDISGDAPKELDTLVIGERGSFSEVLQDLHAFSFLLADPQSQQAFRFGLPIAVNGEPFPGLKPGNSFANLQHFPEWSHTGLYLFEVDTTAAKPALKNTGVIKVSDHTLNARDWKDMSLGSNRSVLQGNGIFYSHQTQIWSADWLTPEQAIGPQ